jgi:hypothetical protein
MGTPVVILLASQWPTGSSSTASHPSLGSAPRLKRSRTNVSPSQPHRVVVVGRSSRQRSWTDPNSCGPRGHEGCWAGEGHCGVLGVCRSAVQSCPRVGPTEAVGVAVDKYKLEDQTGKKDKKMKIKVPCDHGAPRPPASHPPRAPRAAVERPREGASQRTAGPGPSHPNPNPNPNPNHCRPHGWGGHLDGRGGAPAELLRRRKGKIGAI